MADIYSPSEREAEILKPLASVEVTEKEDAMFETEISEDDVPGEWKLKGEVLTRSPVRQDGLVLLNFHLTCISTSACSFYYYFCLNLL